MSLSDSAAECVWEALRERGWLLDTARQPIIDAIQVGLDRFIDSITEDAP